MTTVEVLRAAKALIDAPEKWTKEVSARDKDGLETSILGKEACRFCMLGAIDRVQWASPAGEFLHRSLGVSSVPDWQDKPTRTHAEVMAAFDRAIELAEAEESP